MLFTPEYSIKMPIGETLMTSIVGIMTVLLILAIIDLLIMLVSKIIRVIEAKLSGKKAESAAETASAASDTPLPEGMSQGELELIGVDEPTAAVIMALVSHQSGIPLNRLCFKSIRSMEDEKK